LYKHACATKKPFSVWIAASSLLVVLLFSPAPGFSSVFLLHYSLSLQSVTLATTLGSAENNWLSNVGPGSQAAASNDQRWYMSLLTQQELISQQTEELRNRLHDNLIGTEEFLDGLDALLVRTEKLYGQWKRLGTSDALTPGPNGAHGTGGTENTRDTEPGDGRRSRDYRRAPKAGAVPSDMAVGKSLNYLKLSLLNFFLGYSDRNGRQIDDAEKQVSLSRLWRTRSLLFIQSLRAGSLKKTPTEPSLGQAS